MQSLTIRRITRTFAFTGALALLLGTTGCFGRFRLTTAVYQFNKSFNNKFAQELVFLGMHVIPIYEVAILADAFVFNVIDFWTAGSHVARVDTHPDGSQTEIARVSDNVVRVRHQSADGRLEEIELVQVGESSGYVRRPDGTRLASLERLPDGTFHSQIETRHVETR